MVTHHVDITDMWQHRLNVEFSKLPVVSGIKSTASSLRGCWAAIMAQYTAASTTGRLNCERSRQVLSRNFVTMSSTTRPSFIFYYCDYHRQPITTTASRDYDKCYSPIYALYLVEIRERNFCRYASLHCASRCMTDFHFRFYQQVIKIW